jgi:hypothetical protein
MLTALSGSMVKIFVFPVAAKRWVFVFKEMFEMPTKTVTQKSWRDGTDLRQKGRLFVSNLVSKTKIEIAALEHADPSPMEVLCAHR